MLAGTSYAPQKSHDTLAADYRFQLAYSFSLTDTLSLEASVTPQSANSKSPQNGDETEFLGMSVHSDLCQSGGETGPQPLPEEQTSQNFQTARLVHRSAKKAFQSSDISSQACSSFSSKILFVLQLIHHHEERHRYTTEDHHLIGGTPFGSKVHDPFHLHGLNPRQLWEGLFVILIFSPVLPGLCRPQPPCMLCQVQKDLRRPLCQIEGLCVVALQHLPYFIHDEVWSPKVLGPGPHVLVEPAEHL